MAKTESRFTSLVKGTALLAGTTIGAGILAIPYAIAQSGYWLGMAYIVGLGMAMILLNLFLAEISLRTEGTQQLPGLAGKYLGKDAKALTLFGMLALIYGALTAYMIGSADILSTLTGLPSNIMGLTFFFFVVFGVYFGLKVVSKAEMLFVFGLILIVLGIVARAFSIDNLFQWEVFRTSPPLQLSTAFIPYGTILFSFFGFVAIPEVENIMIKHKQDIHVAVILGIAIPMVLYILFTTVVLGVAGYDMPEVATIALGQALGPEVQVIANIFGIIAMYTSALSLSISAIHTYQEEFSFPHFSSVVITIFPPIIVLLSGIGGFFQFISFTGAVIGSLIGVLVVFMYWQAKETGDAAPEFSLGSMKWGGVVLTSALLVGLVSSIL